MSLRAFSGLGRGGLLKWGRVLVEWGGGGPFNVNIHNRYIYEREQHRLRVAAE